MPQHGLLGQRRHAGWDLPIDRDITDPDLLDWSDESAGFTGMPIKKALALKSGNVLHHGRLAGETKMTLDFARTRRDAFLALFALNKVEHTSLAIGQHSRKRCDASVQVQVQMNTSSIGEDRFFLLGQVFPPAV